MLVVNANVARSLNSNDDDDDDDGDTTLDAATATTGFMNVSPLLRILLLSLLLFFFRLSNPIGFPDNEP